MFCGFVVQYYVFSKYCNSVNNGIFILFYLGFKSVNYYISVPSYSRVVLDSSSIQENIFDFDK